MKSCREIGKLSKEELNSSKRIVTWCYCNRSRILANRLIYHRLGINPLLKWSFSLYLKERLYDLSPVKMILLVDLKIVRSNMFHLRRIKIEKLK